MPAIGEVLGRKAGVTATVECWLIVKVPGIKP
jgi:hypothetical protein